MNEVIDVTPTTAGTLRIWARLIESAILNIQNGKRQTGTNQLELVVMDMYENAKRLGNA